MNPLIIAKSLRGEFHEESKFPDTQKNLQHVIGTDNYVIQYSTIPIGILLGGFLADYVFEPFMHSNQLFALLLQRLVGSGKGSGMAVMFLCTGIFGFITSVLWYRSREINKINNITFNSII